MINDMMVLPKGARASKDVQIKPTWACHRNPQTCFFMVFLVMNTTSVSWRVTVAPLVQSNNLGCYIHDLKSPRTWVVLNCWSRIYSSSLAPLWPQQTIDNLSDPLLFEVFWFISRAALIQQPRSTAAFPVAVRGAEKKQSAVATTCGTCTGSTDRFPGAIAGTPHPKNIGNHSNHIPSCAFQVCQRS